MNLPKYKRAAEVVRGQIADGVLAPGASAPSGAKLARMTGYSVLTCRRALQTLVEEGVLIAGVSPSARPRVPSPARPDLTLDDAKRELSAALADRRHAMDLTQPRLAEMAGVSLTSVGHAETGRLWQGRPFWESVDKVLNADGALLRLYEVYRALEAPPPVWVPPTPAITLIVWSDGAVSVVPMTPRHYIGSVGRPQKVRHVRERPGDVT